MPYEYEKLTYPNKHACLISPSIRLQSFFRVFPCLKNNPKIDIELRSNTNLVISK